MLIRDRTGGEVITGNCARNWNFDYTNIWYMQKLESVLENETHKFLSDYEITKKVTKSRPDDQTKWYSTIKKENLPNSGCCLSVDHRVKLKANGKRDVYLDLVLRSKRVTG